MVKFFIWVPDILGVEAFLRLWEKVNSLHFSTFETLKIPALKRPPKLKIFNDPIYGFIRIPNRRLFDLIAHPYFQRLRRISQMGMSYLVYPGAHHTRFHHALGAMHLMQQAVGMLRLKGVEISQEQADGLYCALLLHDIGHGPFSHALEQEFLGDTVFFQFGRVDSPPHP